MEIKAESVKPYSEDDRQKGEQVRDMFDSIAPAYDFMNRAMTLGIDTLWRKKAVSMIKKDASSHSVYNILDVATGTADLAIAMASRIPQAHVTGIDLSKGMVDLGIEKVRKAGLSDRVALKVGDCLNLPFADATFDCISVAFGVRNFQRLSEGYREMHRVLRPGGMLYVLELSTPQSPVIKPLYKFYSTKVIPFVGRLISKDTSAYSYLPASIEAVPQRTQMTALISEAGFSEARYISLTFGVCTLYIAKR